MSSSQEASIEKLSQLVEQVEILSTLPDQEKRELFKCIRIMHGKVGQTVIREGSERSDLMFVIEGHLKVCRADERGREVILALIGAGDFFGELSLLTGAQRCADVVTLMPSIILTLDGEDFLSHIQRWPGLSSNMLRAMARRVQFATQRITELSLFDVSCRVARILWSLGLPEASHAGTVSVLRELPTHQTIASMVGSSREVVSRALKSLEESGHLQFDEEIVIVKSIP